MKKLITLAMLAIAAMSFAQDAGRMHYVQLVNPIASAALDGTGVDISPYKGNAAFLVEWATNTSTGHVASVTLQTSANNSTWVTVTNIAGTAVISSKTGVYTNTVPEKLNIDSNRLRKYVRAKVAQTGSTNAVSAIMVFPFKSE